MAAKSPFTSETYKFLKDLDANNNREWFRANKRRYEEHVKEPLLQFIASMQGPLARISRHIVADPSPVGGSMFRIYRDTRFSSDQTPYKTHAAAQFRHEVGKDAHAPGYYFHLSPAENIVGGGIWLPETKVLNVIRSRIAHKPDEWKKVITSRKLREVAGGVHGDELKRPPRGFDPEHKYVEYLKMKSYFSGVEFPRKYVLSGDWQDEVVDVFKAAAPLMKFLCDALGLPW